MSACDVVSVYRFTRVESPRRLGESVREAAAARGLLGTAIVAPEGLNATFSGARDSLEHMLAWLEGEPGFDALRGRWSRAMEAPFRRLRIKYRDEIVSMGHPDINPADGQGEHVDAARWNALLADPETLVIDTRNDYEIELGSFDGAVDPGTRSFREFTAFVENELANARQRPVAMFCTGGIRCEKATAVMRRMGFDTLYQLDGGVLGYLDAVAEDPTLEQKWRGDCFVFDARVAVDPGLAPGDYAQCHGCRRALSAADLEHPDYEAGICCASCKPALDDEQRLRLEERRRQVLLAEARGEQHIGAVYPADEAAGLRRSDRE